MAKRKKKNNIIKIISVFIIIYLIISVFSALSYIKTKKLHTELCSEKPIVGFQGVVGDGYAVSCFYDNQGNLIKSKSIANSLLAPLHLIKGSTCSAGFGVTETEIKNGVGCSIIPFWKG